MRRLIRVLGPVAVVASLIVIVPAAPAAASGGLTIRADTLYDIQAEQGVVAVTSDLSVTNVTPDKRSGYTITQYYYYAISLPIPPEAENVAATSGGRNLTVTIEEGEPGLYDIAQIRLRSRLYYQQTHTIQLTFDLVGQEPRSEVSEVRVNNAFVWFYAWAFGDNGRATVRVVAPRGLDVSINGRYMKRTTADDGRPMWVAEDIPYADLWFVSVEGWADGRLASTSVDVDGNHISVRYWPGDEEWRNDVVAAVETALPALIDTVGLGWPVEDQLVVRETITPNVFGYGGWYLFEDDIEIGEYVDNELVVHEVSHAWFNDDLFEPRWITEGLAEAVTEVVLWEAFDERVYPDFASTSDPGFRKLNTWETPETAADIDEDTESYAYNASWYVMSEIIDEIGPEGLQEVLSAAANDEIAYVGAGDPEQVDEVDGWRRLLDLVEERGGATSATDLFTDYVVATADLDELEARTTARAAYAGLIEARSEWSPPIIVRQPMEDWEFDEAVAQIDAAGAVLDAMEDLEAHAAALDLSPSAAVQPAYEAVTWSFNGTEALIADQESALSAIDEASAAVSADRDEATILGLAGRNPDAELAAARAAFEDDRFDDARLHAALAVAMLEGAPQRGEALAAAASRQQATIIALAAAVGLWLLGVLILRSRRRRRSAYPVADSPVYGPPTPLPVHGPPTPEAVHVGASADPGPPAVPPPTGL